MVGLGMDPPGAASGWSLGRWPGWPGSSVGPGEGSSPAAVGDALVGLAVCWWCATEGQAGEGWGVPTLPPLTLRVQPAEHAQSQTAHPARVMLRAC